MVHTPSFLAPPADDACTFYMQLNKNIELIEASLTSLRKNYPTAPLILSYKKELSSTAQKIANTFNAVLIQSEASTHATVQTVLKKFLEGDSIFAVFIDPALRIDRAFSWTPTPDAVYTGQPYGIEGRCGCMAIPRLIAKRILNSRITSTGLVDSNAENVLQAIARNLSLPMHQWTEICSHWPAHNPKRQLQYATVYPDEFQYLKNAVRLIIYNTHKSSINVYNEATQKNIIPIAHTIRPTNVQKNNSARRPYKRVCIVSWPRSGSNLLISLLNSHPDVLFHNEVLHPNVSGASTMWRNRINTHYTPFSDAAEFIDRFVFPAEDVGKKAVGFKLFRPHMLTSAGANTLLPYLQTENDIHMLKLIRSNILDCALSDIIASHTGVYVRENSGQEKETISQRIEPGTLYRKMLLIEAEQVFIKESFSEHPSVLITYEDLVLGTESIMHSLFAWLGVKMTKPKVSRPLYRQRTRTRTEVIRNFNEVRAFIKRKRPDWDYFFGDATTEGKSIVST